MRRSEYPFNGKRYLLNANTKEVHDLDNERAGCQIGLIDPKHIFMADNLKQALNFPTTDYRRNDGCMYCLKAEHTK